MEYIDKNKSREWAHALINEFLDTYIKDNGTYPNELYEAFMSSTDFKKRFVDKLLEDNHNRCCYCMRDIKGTTLEHVIPQKATEDDLKKYFETESALDENNIEFEKKFLATPHKCPPFPHTLAYENLIPSCFGHLPSGKSKCCNCYRGDKFLTPLVFRPHIHNEIKYKTDGSIVWIKDQEIIPAVTTLGLDCLELKAIRRLWYYLVSHNLSNEETNKNKAVDDLIIEMGEIRNAQDRNFKEMLLNFKNTEYWNLLGKYTYFNNKKIFEEKIKF